MVLDVELKAHSINKIITQGTAMEKLLARK